MPQPVKHSTDVMLDAVRSLVLSGGPAAASARAVCLATGASSGSVYHRFPRRDDLVAAAWLRAQDRFLRVYLEALGPADAQAGVGAAVTVLTWCRSHPEDAALLLRHALRDLLRGDTSPALAQQAQAHHGALGDALTAVARATGHRLTDVVLALVDLPYAVARRAMRDHGTPDEDDIAAVRRAVALLLPGPDSSLAAPSQTACPRD
ncbi:TetR/AcrR family transcriptional regulator [Micromonospora sp. NPDC048170]|uniref:TetR/AcrR family transcriptional regulator n=1 Tax=Micromonospora sp. NPDC048170 TaxID=3154819 RepID=UPI0033ED0E37